MDNPDDKFSAIRKGLLEFLVLTIISRREVYAADILGALASTDFATQEGTLYPLFSRLRREGFVAYEWVESESGPPRKYYSLTARGRDHLQTLKEYWKEINNTINKLGK